MESPSELPGPEAARGGAKVATWVDVWWLCISLGVGAIGFFVLISVEERVPTEATPYLMPALGLVAVVWGIRGLRKDGRKLFEPRLVLNDLLLLPVLGGLGIGLLPAAVRQGHPAHIAVGLVLFTILMLWGSSDASRRGVARGWKRALLVVGTALLGFGLMALGALLCLTLVLTLMHGAEGIAQLAEHLSRPSKLTTTVVLVAGLVSLLPGILLCSWLRPRSESLED